MLVLPRVVYVFFISLPIWICCDAWLVNATIWALNNQIAYRVRKNCTTPNRTISRTKTIFGSGFIALLQPVLNASIPFEFQSILGRLWRRNQKASNNDSFGSVFIGFSRISNDYFLVFFAAAAAVALLLGCCCDGFCVKFQRSFDYDKTHEHNLNTQYLTFHRWPHAPHHPNRMT